MATQMQSIGVEQQEILVGIEMAIAEASMKVMSANLAKPVSLSVEDIAPLDMDKLTLRFQEQCVTAYSPFKQGNTGIHIFLFDLQTVAEIGDLMMMGDGNAEFSEEHLDALKELVDQMMDAAGTRLSEELGKTLEFDPCNVTVTALAEMGLNAEELIGVHFALNIQDYAEHTVVELIDYDAVDGYTAKLIGREARKEPSSKSPLTSPPSSSQNTVKVKNSKHVQPAKFRPLTEQEMEEKPGNIDLLMDLSVDITVELGRTRMLVRDFLRLRTGSIIELDKLTGEPVDLLVNGKKYAEGEVVVVQDESFGVRITNILESKRDREVV